MNSTVVATLPGYITMKNVACHNSQNSAHLKIWSYMTAEIPTVSQHSPVKNGHCVYQRSYNPINNTVNFMSKTVTPEQNLNNRITLTTAFFFFLLIFCEVEWAGCKLLFHKRSTSSWNISCNLFSIHLLDNHIISTYFCLITHWSVQLKERTYRKQGGRGGQGRVPEHVINCLAS